ncbi:hypothetical protein [Dongia deserti]|uniref:hypothetical protein n=1 Tax=Dongia deserti TaxID=2268030 RepID=UPI000E64C3E1|nr:hypothetical protein [Dongia deserti]
MTTLPAANAIATAATQAAQKINFEALRAVIAELLGGEASTQLTIAGGVVTATRAQHSIDTEGATATDDLDRIAQDNHPDGRFLVIRSANAARTVVVKHNAGGLGTILLHDGVNFSLNSTKKALLLRREGTTWVEVDRVYGDKIEEMRAWLKVEPDTVSTAVDRNITAPDRGKVITLTGATDRTFTFTATWAALGDGWNCYFKNASTAFLTIVPASGTIAGKATLVLKPGELVEVRSDGANGDLLGGILIWRERLTANRTYFVNPAGNDNNNGLTVGAPFLTLQKAWDVIHDTLDLNGFIVTVQLADGTYNTGVLCEGLCVGQDSYANIVFQGNNANPAAVVVSTTSASCFTARTGGQFTVKDLKVQTTTAGSGVRSIFYGSVVVCRNLNYGACVDYHNFAGYQGYLSLNNGDNYTISGGAFAHYYAFNAGLLDAAFNATCTLTGNPAFTDFARAENGGVIDARNATFSGSATGQRYDISANSLIDTNSGGASYFPGNSAGAVTTGGQYV